MSGCWKSPFKATSGGDRRAGVVFATLLLVSAAFGAGFVFTGCDPTRVHPDAGVRPDGACPPTEGACAVPGCSAPGILPAGIALTDVWVGTAGDVWAVGEAGFLGRRAPETGAWCWCAPLPPQSLRSVWGSSSDNLFAVGDSGTLIHFDGTRWAHTLASNLDLRAVHGTSADNVWVVGERGMALRFNGSAWEYAHSADFKYNLHAVWLDAAGTVRAGGSAPLPELDPGSSYTAEGVVLRYGGEGAGWSVEGSFPQRGAVGIFALEGTPGGTSPSNNVWAAGINTPSGAAAGYGTIVHFDGSGWSIAPHSPDEFDTLFQSHFFRDIEAAAPDGAAWFVGGVSGLRYDGYAWTVVPELAPALAIDARDGVMYAVGENGVILRWGSTSGWTVERAGTAPPATVPAP